MEIHVQPEHCELRLHVQRPWDIHDNAEIRFGVLINIGILTKAKQIQRQVTK